MKLRTSYEPAVCLGFILIALFLMMLPSAAWAALGDNASSVLSDQAHMKGTLRSVDNSAYVLHEITMPSGAKVREFASPAGVIFGVAWEGQMPPDLQQLLGPYYAQAQQASAQNSSEKRRSRGAPVVINTPGLVFTQSGHVRRFHGQAYIPQLVPQGVQASNIR
jgi:hypothetical protein